ncbi:MAG: Uncharacterised protein [Candidatus Poseidoniaceae archaeon]|nr:MAG: Uncharacterised protein [Candidatus Poseidoniaceae archaeon]
MESGPATSEEIEEQEVLKEEINEESVEIQHELMDVLALPIRAKPLFHNNHEDVDEFPLSESKDGLRSTSIVVGDGLLRVVETTLHQDGVPRIDVQLVMDAELTSFQHVIDKPASIKIGLSAGFTLVGLLLMMVQGLTPIVLGLGLFLVGLKFLPTHLEKHRLMFSSCGNSHEIELGTWNIFTPGFRASMALIGPAMADYMRIGQLDVSEINEVHRQLRTPIVPVMEQAVTQLSEPTAPVEIVPPQIPEMVPVIVAPETEPTVNEAPAQEMPAPVGPPVSTPAPSEPMPAPLPPPLAPPVGPPNPAPPPMMPQPLPTPMPPPIAPLPAGPPGMNQPIPLDMPMPEAPRIAVQATPSDEPTISQEEQNALLNELS